MRFFWVLGLFATGEIHAMKWTSFFAVCTNPLSIVGARVQARDNEAKFTTALRGAVARNLRSEMSYLNVKPETAAKDLASHMKKIKLHPEFHLELKQLGTHIDSELKSLERMQSAVKFGELDGLEKLNFVLAKEEALARFQEAYREIPQRVQMENMGNDFSADKLEDIVAERRETFLQEFKSWGEGLEERVKELRQLRELTERQRAARDVSLYDYLEDYSRYLNHFAAEPSELHRVWNLESASLLKPESFASHNLAKELKLFPDSMYFPVSRELSVAEVNDLHASGLYPVQILAPGQLSRADGRVFNSPLAHARNDLAQRPLLGGKNGGEPLSARELAIMSDVREKFRQYVGLRHVSDEDHFRERMEALYHFYFREKSMSLDDFVGAGLDKLVGDAFREAKKGSLAMILKDRSFSSPEQMRKYVVNMFTLLEGLKKSAEAR
jgi:hypothetical protein